MHDFSLLHDDIIDGDQQRRHRPTVWALFGIGQAILVGDALQTLAHQVLLDQRTEAGIAAGHRLATAVAEMIAGQADDMALESEEHVGVDECERMAAAKTGALLSCAAALGAELAGGDARAVDALADFGAHVGLSFQAVDDVLGIWGDPAITGKPVGSDLTSKKKTLPVAFAMAASSDAARELQAMFRNGNLDEAAVRRATDLVEGVGAREATEEFAASAPPRWPWRHSTPTAWIREITARAPRGRRVRLRAPAVTGEPLDPTTVGEARDRAVEALLGMQHADGWWKGELQANVTIDAEDLLLREFLGIRTDALTEATAKWIRAQQRDDGTWATFTGGPADLSTTVEAYAALRLAGDTPEATHMEKAAAFVRDAGGLERARVFTHMWLALGGQWSWDQIPALPPEVILLPSRVPLNIYDFACWARQTIVALTVVAAHRPSRPLPFALDELRTGAQPPARRSLRTVEGKFELLDRVLRRYERHPLRWLRRTAIDRAVMWILARQEADGSWGGIQPPWVYSLLALHLEGFALDHPVMRAGFEGLDRFTIEDELGRRVECCQSPVWDTALAMIGLSDAGVAADHPALQKAAGWVLGEEIRRARRLGRAPPRPRAERVGLRVRERQLRRHRRHGDRRPRPAACLP